MSISFKTVLLLLLFIAVFLSRGESQNPIITDQFTADPSAHVFNGKLYVYPSHDILAVEGEGRPGWFCMEDYHVFSSENLTKWIDHGIIVSQNKVAWVDSNSYSMWAPDCIERNGKFYFYFPSNAKPKDDKRRPSFRIGVAIADKPEGPFTPQENPIDGILGIDPCVFIDNDGQAYIYWSMGNIYVAKLKDNMLELDSEPLIIENLPDKGLKEGPFVFKRDSLYYLTFPHVENKTERLEYAIGYSPMGPFKLTGVIMDESPMNCWTNHQSIVQFENQWYLFYHQNAYSPNFDKNRSICIDSLFFNQDGSIQKVVPTHRGVGITSAKEKIQIDRYSSISNNGATINFVDTLDPFKGWKTEFYKKDSWITYENIQFPKKKINKVQLWAKAKENSIIQIIRNNNQLEITDEIVIPKSNDWILIKDDIKKQSKGIYNLKVISQAESMVEIDWIKFSER